MKKHERVVILRDAAMKLVAEKSLVGLSMRQVSERSGVNQSMIYRDFKSKENFLLACYESVNDDYLVLIRRFLREDMKNGSVIDPEIEAKWNSFVDLLIESDYKTIYHCEYRHSSFSPVNIEMMLDRVEEEVGRESASRVMETGEIPPAITGERGYRDVMIHFIETGISYAKKVITQESEDSAYKRSKMWKLLTDGLAPVKN